MAISRAVAHLCLNLGTTQLLLYYFKVKNRVTIVVSHAQDHEQLFLELAGETTVRQQYARYKNLPPHHSQITLSQHSLSAHHSVFLSGAFLSCLFSTREAKRSDSCSPDCVAGYSLTYQNVQSSEGSKFIEVHSPECSD
jgi:hypothetical protein